MPFISTDEPKRQANASIQPLPPGLFCKDRTLYFIQIATMIFFKIFQEGIILALQELWSNKLRSFLSLLGIAIGIFCVIAVLSVIDSFQHGLKDSFNKIGSNVLHVSKESWDFKKITSDWWKYMRRPNPNYKEYEALRKYIKTADAINIRAVMGGQKLQNRDNVVENVALLGSTYDLARMFDLEIDYGRYFTGEEMQTGRNMVVLGYVLAEALFPNVDYAIGKSVKLKGRKLKVIGVFKKEGESIIGDGFDEVAVVPYNYFRKYFNINNRRMQQTISVRAAENVSMEQLTDEMRGVMRGQRHLKPKEEDNFEINNLSLLTGMIDGIFGVVSIAGGLIGFFAILVGAFGIANIMFVSVKERTRIIGIKKSLGAKRIYILLEFLVEAILLTLLGGFFGLLLVYLLVFVGNNFIDQFELFLSQRYIIWGMALSVVIGVIAGIIPAFLASQMDPVEAIRS